MSRYRVRSSHAEDIASGAVFAPGETVIGVDPKDPYDRAKIKTGVLVEIPLPVKHRKASKKEEE